MTEAMREALEMVAAERAARPAAYALARVVSLAARVEPALVRRARLDLLPRFDAGAEADLWFSPLVQSRSPAAIVFVPEVAEVLRRDLARDQELLGRAWGVVSRVHEKTSPVIRLEEEVTYLALSERADAVTRIRELLLSAARAMVEGDGRGLAQWALRALPRLPEAARNSEAAWALAVGAGARLGGRRVLTGEAPGAISPTMLRWVLPGDHQKISVGVRLTEAGVEFTEPPAAGAHVIQLPKTDPLLLEVSWGTGPEANVRQVTLRPGQTQVVEAESPDEVVVNTPAGETFTLRREYDSDVFIETNDYDVAGWAEMLASRLREEDWDGRPLKVVFGFESGSLPVYPEAMSSRDSGEVSVMMGQAMMNDGSARQGSRKIIGIISDKTLELYEHYPEVAPRGAESRKDRRQILIYRGTRELPPELNSRVEIDFRDNSRFEENFRRLLAAIKGEPFTEPSESAESDAPPVLEIAHVLFMDIVGYSKLPMDEQTRVLQQLYQIARGTTQFRQAEQSQDLIRLPTGDGMALVFFGDPESALRCALEISRALREAPALKLRMGVHTGPVYRVGDINANVNVQGSGIYMAQRVMDCGDAGHVLVSAAVAETLGQLSTWAASLHDLGEAEVKNGVRLHLFNVYADDFGNPEPPEKLRAGRPLVYISHSAKDELSAAILETLVDALSAAGFECFADRGRLRPGSAWQEESSAHLARAEAAVVLLSASALESQWVLREIAVLSHRRQVVENFIMLPVLLGEVRIGNLPDAFAPLGFQELEAVRAEGPPAETASRIVEALAPLKERGPRTASYEERLEDAVARNLWALPEESLRELMPRLYGEDEAAETPASRRTLARRIVRGGLFGLEENLRPLVQFVGTSVGQRILDVVAPTWVTPTAADAVRRVAARPPGQRALCVNGTRLFTGQSYVSRASERWPPWHALAVGKVAGGGEEIESPYTVLAEIEDSLKGLFRLSPGESHGVVDNLLREREEPFFVMFTPPLPPPVLLEGVRSTYPTLTLFLLAGERLPQPDEIKLDGVEIIYPGLGPEEEDRAYGAYTTLRAMLSRSEQR